MNSLQNFDALNIRRFGNPPRKVCPGILQDIYDHIIYKQIIA